MILSLFSLFMFLVFVRVETVEPVDLSRSMNDQEEEDSTVTPSTQQEEDCRYQDTPISRRDLSDYVVVSEIPSETHPEKEAVQDETETNADSDESNDVNVELELTPKHDETDE